MNHSLLNHQKLEDGILILSLERPDKRNALNLEMMDSISNAFEQAKQDLSLRIIILKAEGRSFSAGLDLDEAADINLAEKMAMQFARMLSAIYNSPLVTIACLQGDAVAGGAGLAIACDFTIAAAGTRIGFPEVRRGLIAAQVSTLLSRQIPLRQLKELLLLGELIDVKTALSLGLINRIVDHEALLSEAMNIARLILKGAPEAIHKTKELLHRLDPSNFSGDLKEAIVFHHSARQSDEAKEGIKAFIEKRPPVWDNKRT